MTKHSHYFKDVSHLDKIDVYRVLDLFGVQNPAIQHAIKKLLCAGSRGVKDQARDYREAIDSIERALQMLDEDARPDDGKTRTAGESPTGGALGWDFADEPTERPAETLKRLRAMTRDAYVRARGGGGDFRGYEAAIQELFGELLGPDWNARPTVVVGPNGNTLEAWRDAPAFSKEAGQ